MIDTIAAFVLATASQSGEQVRVQVYGRDYVTVTGSTETFRGTCDGREVSAMIIKAFRGQSGRLTLRAGDITRTVSPDFLNRRLFGSSFYAAGLGCDGRRIVFRVRLAQMDPSGSVTVRVQSATMDMQTGAISLSTVRELGQEEVRAELQ